MKKVLLLLMLRKMLKSMKKYPLVFSRDGMTVYLELLKIFIYILVSEIVTRYSNLNANIVFLPYKAFKAQTISDRLYIENAIGKGDAAKIRLEGKWFLEMLHETGQ